MNDLFKLADDMDALNERIPFAANEKKIELGLAIQTELTRVTPVDTSKAVSNWVVTGGRPYDVDIDAYFEGEHGSTYQASIAEVQSQGRRAAALIEPGESLFLADNADYIRELNDGSSNQAPAGFIEKAGMLVSRKLGATKLKI